MACADGLGSRRRLHLRLDRESVRPANAQRGRRPPADIQDITVGDAQKLGKNGPVLRVAVVEREDALVFRSDDGNWVWAFCLVADGTGTRLISRNRIATPRASWPARAFYRYLMEPGSLLMERKMLLGIKQRAERLAGTVRAGVEP